MASGIVIRGASLTFGELTVLGRFDLTLKRGQSLLVTGANGSGKSVLLQVCAGLLPATTGMVQLDGLRPDWARPSSMFRRGVRRGFVFDNGGLIANMSALANVTLALRYHADLLGLSEQDVDDRARKALQEFGVTQSDFHSLPAHLSWGVRKRVSVARALAMEPNFVFFDDPDVGLDADTRTLLHNLLTRLRDDPKVTMMITTGHVGPFEYLGLPVFELKNTYLMEQVTFEGLEGMGNPRPAAENEA